MTYIKCKNNFYVYECRGRTDPFAVWCIDKGTSCVNCRLGESRRISMSLAFKTIFEKGEMKAGTFIFLDMEEPT